MKKQSWSVGIFCFNEKGTLKRVALEVLNLIPSNCTDFELILVDDGSTDGSREIVQAIALEHKDLVHPVFFTENRGIGAALNAIYGLARFENIIALPGDGQFALRELIPYLNFPRHHFLSFYRKENLIYGRFRNELSIVNRKLNQYLLGITVADVNWVHAYKKEDLQKLDLQLRSSLVQSEICAKLLFLEVEKFEIESEYLPRTYGKSKGGSFKIVFQALKDLRTLYKVVRRFKKQAKRKSFPV